MSVAIAAEHRELAARLAEAEAAVVPVPPVRERAARKYGVPEREILIELGRRRIVGGQEDMIVDVAEEFAAQREPVGAKA
jgi:hypothetical protein